MAVGVLGVDAAAQIRRKQVRVSPLDHLLLPSSVLVLMVVVAFESLHLAHAPLNFAYE